MTHSHILQYGLFIDLNIFVISYICFHILSIHGLWIFTYIQLMQVNSFRRLLDLYPVLKLSQNAPERHTGTFCKG